jgi:hypothetical protein
LKEQKVYRAVGCVFLTAICTPPLALLLSEFSDFFVYGYDFDQLPNMIINSIGFGLIFGPFFAIVPSGLMAIIELPKSVMAVQRKFGFLSFSAISLLSALFLYFLFFLPSIFDEHLSWEDAVADFFSSNLLIFSTGGVVSALVWWRFFVISFRKNNVLEG